MLGNGRGQLQRGIFVFTGADASGSLAELRTAAASQPELDGMSGAIVNGIECYAHEAGSFT